ncbi:glycosyltransferase [Marinobacter salinexigens]|nr:glycosyltransferase [Marinobacter salinexigens]
MQKFKNVKYLPPGAEIDDTRPPKIQANSNDLKVFYVGGIEPPTYDLRPLLSAVNQAPSSVTLTICCRKKEWDQVGHLYLPLLNSRIKVVHKSGQDLNDLYRDADLFAIVRSQGSYLDYSVPIKIYEAIGFSLPILCTPGGETARIVESEKLGWVKDEKDISGFLETLSKQPQTLKRTSMEIKDRQNKHTWLHRASQVCENILGH